MAQKIAGTNQLLSVSRRTNRLRYKWNQRHFQILCDILGISKKHIGVILAKLNNHSESLLLPSGREESYGLSQVTGSFLEIQKGSC